MSSSKNFLYNLILKNLRAYHARSKSKSARILLQEQWTDIYILLDKGLRKQVLQKIRKAKKIAGAYQFTLDQINLLLLERSLTKEYERKNTRDKMQELRKKCHQLAGQFIEEEKILSDYEDAFICVRNKDLKQLKNTFPAWHQNSPPPKVEADNEACFWQGIYTNNIHTNHFHTKIIHTILSTL